MVTNTSRVESEPLGGTAPEAPTRKSVPRPGGIYDPVARVLDVIGDMAVFDHWRQRVTLISTAMLGPAPTDDEIDRAYDDAVVRLDQLARDGASPLDEPLLAPPDPATDAQLDPSQFPTSLSSDLYQKAVEAAKEYIRAGDIFQVVLSKRFEIDLDADSTADPRMVEALREWRAAEARKKRIPAFRIFSNKTLLALAEARPSDEEELLAVKGVGSTLARKYGERLLSLLRRD